MTRPDPHAQRLDVAWLDIDDVKPYARNPRKHGAAIEKVAASLREFGWRQPLVVDRDHVIVVGHSRWQAARKIGCTKVPVHVAADLTEAQARAYRLMDNRAHEEAEWDDELLALELMELKTSDTPLRATGFDEKELEKLLDADAQAAAGEVGGGGGDPGFEYRVIVDCEDADHQERVIADLEKQGFKCRALIS